MEKLLATIALCFAFTLGISGQTIHAISGGTRTEQDPKDKKEIRLIAEKPEYKLTVGRSGNGKVGGILFGIYLKVENLSDASLVVDPSKFNEIDETGKAYSGLSREEIVDRIINYSPGGILQAQISPRLPNTALERSIRDYIMREAFPPGSIPPHSYKEGVVFLEDPRRKNFTVKIYLSDLWPEPFIFSTEKEKKADGKNQKK